MVYKKKSNYMIFISLFNLQVAKADGKLQMLAVF